MRNIFFNLESYLSYYNEFNFRPPESTIPNKYYNNTQVGNLLHEIEILNSLHLQGTDKNIMFENMIMK